MLIRTLENLELYKESIEKLVEYYKQGDLEGVSQLIYHSPSNTSSDPNATLANDILMVSRNRNWLDKIEKYAQQGGAFIAVGLAHLWGPDGLVSLLTEKGYTVHRK